MRNFWTIVTIGFILIGFVLPGGWIIAAITGIIAYYSSPGGERPDENHETDLQEQKIKHHHTGEKV
jgi:hypothetical protein